MIIAINGYIGSGKDAVAKIIQGLVIDQKDPSFFEVPKSAEYPREKHTLLSYLQEDYTPATMGIVSGWEIKKFAKTLKEVASLLTGIPVENFENQEFKKSFLPQEWNSIVMEPQPGLKQDGFLTRRDTPVIKQMTVREFLQRLGTDAIRDKLHVNTWANALFSTYVLGPHKGVTRDLKHPNWIISDMRFPNEYDAVKKNNGITIRIDRPGCTAEGAHESETSLDNHSFDCYIRNEGSFEDLIDNVRSILVSYKIILHNPDYLQVKAA